MEETNKAKARLAELVDEPYFCPFEVQISDIDKTTIKVIGNIHDNPELLEVE